MMSIGSPHFHVELYCNSLNNTTSFMIAEALLDVCVIDTEARTIGAI